MNRYKLIGIEPISENEIANYTFDGNEILENPENPNEEFLNLTRKIDFKKLNGETLDYTSQNFPCNDEESELVETHQNIVTEKLKKHLTCSIEEINALIDILQITSKNMGYMTLEKLQKDHTKEAHEENLPSYIAGKKMAFYATGNTLLNGATRLSKSVSNAKDQHHQNTFYSDLALLRKEWRIKWFQANLVGDLGLTSCGSIFPELGGFQIMEEEKNKDLDLQSLKVVLMHNQEGEPVMRINVRDTSIDIGGYDEVKSFMDLPPAKDLNYQMERLNRGQNLLFLSEIFSTLCWEARIPISPVMIKEHRLTVNIRGRDNLEVDFFILPEKHWFGYQDTSNEEVLQTRCRHEKSLQDTSLMSDSTILLLRELLREKHRSNFSSQLSISNPIGGPVQIPLERRFHGVQWYRPLDRSYTEQNNFVYLLPTLIDAVTFQQARKELLVLLDNISDNSPPGISVTNHINASQSMLNCSISLIIQSTTYCTLSKYFTILLSVSKAVIHINIISDQMCHQLVYDTIDTNVLASFFECQIWNFKLSLIKQLATVKHNWQLIEMRLTSCQRTVQEDIRVGIVLLASSGRTLLSIEGHRHAKRYQLTVSYVNVDGGRDLGPMTAVDLVSLQRRLLKTDLDVIDVLFTAFN